MLGTLGGGRSTAMRAVTFSMLLAIGAAAHANLIVNGGFETGDLSGWTQFGDTGFTGVDSTYPYAGTYAAYFGPIYGYGGIEQTIATTPGYTYEIEFWLRNSAGPQNGFRMSWGDDELVALTNVNAFAYQRYAFAVLATEALTNVRFTFFHVPDFWDLDEVSVVAVRVPEPGSMALVGLTMVGVVALRRRRR